MHFFYKETFKYFRQIPECEVNISLPSFAEPLSDVKLHAFALSTQRMVYYDFIPGDLEAGNMGCWFEWTVQNKQQKL